MGLGGFLWVAFSLAASSPRKGLRVNRSLRATHSRREVNFLIAEGRIMVNDIVVTSPDDRLLEGDGVKLDGCLVTWEEKELDVHRYIKFNKPKGIVCTTDRRVPGNILDAFEQSCRSANNNNNDQANDAIAGNTEKSNRRVFPIGRLDAESTGLILLTSDGRIVNPLLRAGERKTKTYHVKTRPRATEDNIVDLANGVVITTLARRDGVAGVPVTACTLPCLVERVGVQHDNDVEKNKDDVLSFVIREGRNRQIRKMCSKLGLEVTNLHRVAFSGITLSGCEDPGDWAALTKLEQIVIGAGPTRDERRTPEERARRKLKKLAKKRKIL